ncbi:VOC family protein [Shewanella yunxiaonensis]|uniref:VOC family protein n=1 Tax=Shewanella yunxiaonensis TaxID=2829809 RepID=A0ABX7YR08_9GAMM|nr:MULTISPECIES: VOC family protein [Shewanella]MDF0534003.1 VOC family protein [Shewanella sp. A32]QUN05205.1 VOC family protein [Shewanella yunxiaonensis]
MPAHEKLNYLEFPAVAPDATKAFFAAVFGWRFVDYGPDYTAFEGAGMDGGFYRAPLASTTDKGAVLPVFYSSDILATQAKIEASGGKVIKPLFSFPGGYRFHFLEPSGNEFAVWSETAD